MKKYLVVFFFFLVSTKSFSVETLLKENNPFEIGLSLQFLVPNRLPDFDLPVTAFGALVGIPIGSDTISLQGTYGGSEVVSLYILEAGYRLNIPTPFFKGFATAGAHYLHYGHLKNDHGIFGPVAGFGFFLPMVKNFAMGMHMKLYWASEILLSFGGSFAFSL